MNIINCEEKYPGISNKLKQSSLKNSICLEAEQGYEIQGEQLTKDIVDFKFIAINLKKKENSTVNMSAIEFLFFYTDYSINTKLNAQSPIEYSMKQMEIDLIEQFELSFDIFLALDEFQSQDNLYASWSERYQQKITRVNRISRRVIEFSSKKKD